MIQTDTPPPRSVDETGKPSFWISQLFILLSTVVGVYLASSQGFKQAMAYGDLQSGRANYYLRQSLYTEIVDNITVLEKYMQDLKSGAPTARQAPASLDMFVWECLKNSPNTLETPTELLRESRAFYREVADIQQKIASNTYAAGYGREQLQIHIDRMRKETLPAFDKNVRDLREALRKRGLEVQ